MSKNILLINPWIYDFAAYDFWLKPLGLLYLGGLLRRNKHRIGFIDCLDPYNPEMQISAKMPVRRPSGSGKFFRQITSKPECLKIIPKNYSRYGILPDIFRRELTSYKETDMVLITSLMTYWYPGVIEAVKYVKEVMPHVPIVLGGKYATLCYNHALKNSGADFVISGQGESQILQLLNKLFGENVLFIPDPSYPDTLPYPAFDLVRHLEQIPIMTSFGCPYKCSYCASHVFNKNFIQRDPLKVADEIEYWQNNFSVKNFVFYDDALLVNSQQNIIVLLRELQKRKIFCNFHCPNGLHLREINEEISILLYDSGFQTIRFGFETSDSGKQHATGGKVKNEELRNAVKYLKKAGYKTKDIGIYLLCALPGQKAEEVKKSMEFVLECGAKPILAEYSPIPGTEMWKEALELSSFDIESEPLYHNNSLLPCRNNDFNFEVYNQLKATLRGK